MVATRHNAKRKCEAIARGNKAANRPRTNAHEGGRKREGGDGQNTAREPLKWREDLQQPPPPVLQLFDERPVRPVKRGNIAAGRFFDVGCDGGPVHCIPTERYPREQDGAEQKKKVDRLGGRLRLLRARACDADIQQKGSHVGRACRFGERGEAHPEQYARREARPGQTIRPRCDPGDAQNRHCLNCLHQEQVVERDETRRAGVGKHRQQAQGAASPEAARRRINETQAHQPGSEVGQQQCRFGPPQNLDQRHRSLGEPGEQRRARVGNRHECGQPSHRTVMQRVIDLECERPVGGRVPRPNPHVAEDPNNAGSKKSDRNDRCASRAIQNNANARSSAVRRLIRAQRTVGGIARRMHPATGLPID
jgi:hypothetical protein